MPKKPKSRKSTILEQPQIPGYYFDAEKNRYFKVETNASASASSQRSIQEKEILKDRSMMKLDGIYKQKDTAYADTSVMQFAKLLHYRSVKQEFPSFVRIASEILLRMHSRRVVYKVKRSFIEQSLWHSFSSKLMMLTSLSGYSRLISLEKNERDNYKETLHESFIDGCVPSWMCGNKTHLVMTFLGSDTPIRIWNFENGSLDSVFPGQINHDIWACSIDHDGNICLIGHGVLHRLSRLSSDVSRATQIRVRDEFGTSDALSMACFSKVLFKTELQDLLITGHRNGFIGLFDSRVRNEVGMFQETSSISCLKPFSFNDSDQSDYYFLSSNMNSEINLYDIRFKGMVQTYAGHVNTHQRLKCDIFNNNIIISPGSDNFIRGWRLSTGELLWQKLLSPAIYASPCHLSLNTSLENHEFFTCQSEEVSIWKL